MLRIEPTWGDVDVLVNVISRLRPNNATQLLAAFPAAHSSSKALQLIRNGAAHNHAQNMTEIQTLNSAYIVFPINHPAQALFWVEPHSNDFLVMNAIQEIRDASLVAVS